VLNIMTYGEKHMARLKHVRCARVVAERS
jgi:hypothetical protein